MKKKLTVILGLVLVMCLLVPVSCTAPPTPMPAPAPVPAPAPAPPEPEPWSPERDKLLKVSREYLAREGGYTINVPPADYLIIPISVGEYEHLAGWGWSAKGKAEDYLDSWLVNDRGNKISESGRAFNYSCGYAYGDNPGLSEGTYYIYLSNEFTSASAKAVTLHVRWT